MQKILIIDDEPGIREILKRYLTKSGYEVEAVSSGKDGIAILDSGGKIDFLIVDMKMPEMKGIEVLKRISQNYSHLPFVLLSGSLELEEYIPVVQGFGFKKFEIGSKPIILQELLGLIQKLLPKE
ncbi:MAG TPA: hypothetical protein DCL35_03375 [Candidatus Omnitrophica bacterium]|nr:hypothetical protein [Candidatus Omnitrophota bacterium]